MPVQWIFIEYSQSESQSQEKCLRKFPMSKRTMQKMNMNESLFISMHSRKRCKMIVLCSFTCNVRVKWKKGRLTDGGDVLTLAHQIPECFNIRDAQNIKIHRNQLSFRVYRRFDPSIFFVFFFVHNRIYLLLFHTNFRRLCEMCARFLFLLLWQLPFILFRFWFCHIYF